MRQVLEVPPGFEPGNGGFADLSNCPPAQSGVCLDTQLDDQLGPSVTTGDEVGSGIGAVEPKPSELPEARVVER